MKLLTERAYIVPFVENQIPDILQMLQEPDSNRFIRPLQEMSVDEMRIKLEENLVKNQLELQFFSAYSTDLNEFIGTLNMNYFSHTPYRQIGVHLSKKYWRQGYGFELCNALTSYAFEERGMDHIHWIFEDGHIASKSLALRLGFKPFRKLKEDGIPLHVFKLLKESR